MNVISFKKLPAKVYEFTKDQYLWFALRGLTCLYGNDNQAKVDFILNNCRWLTLARLGQLSRIILEVTMEHFDGIKAEFLEKAAPILVEEAFTGKFDAVVGLPLACNFSHEQLHYLVTALRLGYITPDDLTWMAGFLWRVYRDEGTEPEEFMKFAHLHARFAYFQISGFCQESAHCEWCTGGYGVCTLDPSLVHPDWTDGSEYSDLATGV